MRQITTILAFNSYLYLMEKIRSICSLLIGLALISLSPCVSLADNFSQYLLEEEYPFVKMQKARFFACAEGGVSFFDVQGDIVIVSKELNEKCFENINRQMALYNKDKLKSRFELSTYPKYSYGLDFNSQRSEYTNEVFNIASVASPFHLTCIEDCKHTKEDLVRFGDRYYFLMSESDAGIDAELINKNIIWFKVHTFTHQNNFVFNIAKEELALFPSGKLKFFEDYVLVMESKSYFKDMNGAFWYDSKVNLEGDFLSFSDVEGGSCFDKDTFNDTIQQQLTLSEKNSLCVTR